jgi:hypothetical protein
MKRDPKPKPELSPKIVALNRLSKDGASSDAATRRRIAVIAVERNLNPSETKALMKGRRISLFLLGQFAEKHHLSVDWLIGGDLKELLETVRGCPSRPQRPQRSQLQEFKEAMNKLDNERISMVLEYAIELAAAEL